MPTDTEKLSDAELLIANARARTRALKYEYLTAEEQLWRDLAAYLEKALADLTARNDTIARVAVIIDSLKDQRHTGDPTVEINWIIARLTKALTPTQPEASEPAATAGLCVYFTGGSFACSTCGIQLEKHPHPPEPAASPDSPERCGADVVGLDEIRGRIEAFKGGAELSKGELLAHYYGLLARVSALQKTNAHLNKVNQKIVKRRNNSEPPTAPPETRTVTLKHARELVMAGLEHAEAARAKAAEDEARAEPETREPNDFTAYCRQQLVVSVEVRRAIAKSHIASSVLNDASNILVALENCILRLIEPQSEPETRDAARERLQCDFQGQMKSTLRYWYNWNKRIEDDETALDAKFDVLLDIIANYIEARAAAAGGKRNE